MVFWQRDRAGAANKREGHGQGSRSTAAARWAGSSEAAAAGQVVSGQGGHQLKNSSALWLFACLNLPLPARGIVFCKLAVSM